MSAWNKVDISNVLLIRKLLVAEKKSIDSISDTMSMYIIRNQCFNV